MSNLIILYAQRGRSNLCFLQKEKSDGTYPRTGSRELRAHVFWARSRTRARPGPDPGPTRLRPGIFFSNMKHPVCTWTYRNHSLTTYNWLFKEKNRYKIISCCLFLSINSPKIKSCRLGEKRRTKVLYVDLSSTVFRF
jgi:hypothetical protein